MLVYSFLSDDTKCLPDFHDQDKDSICGQLLIYLITHYDKEQIEKALQFLFFPSPSIEKSGLAFKYHCDVSSLSVSLVYSKGVLTEPILDMLVQCNLLVKQLDIVQLVVLLDEELELSLFQRLVSICEAQSMSSIQSSLSDSLDKALLSKKEVFASYLLSKGVTPTHVSSSLAYDLLLSSPYCVPSAPSEDFKRIVCTCGPDVRAEFAAKSLAASHVSLFHQVLSSGSLDSSRVDLSSIVSLVLMNEDMKYLDEFLDTGACPDGVPGGSPPLAAVFRESLLTRETQVLLVVILVERGAAVKNLTNAFPDPMSPIHVATKLVLETSKTGYINSS